MDGKTLLYQLRQCLQEGSTSTFLDDRISYDYLYEAASEFVRLTGSLTSTQAITTVSSTSAYNLNADFFYALNKDDTNDMYVKYNDGTSDTFIPFREYSATIYSNNTTAQDIPNSWTIQDLRTNITNISSTCTTGASLSLGEAVLVDSTAPFANVSVGDIIHNISDASDGIVTAKTSTSSISTALFGGTKNYWTTSDAYVIVPQGRKQIVVDPLSKTAGHTITIEYIQKPAPVYTPYKMYRFDNTYMPAIVKYAAWMYKYRDREPNFGDQWYKHWDQAVRRAKANEGKVKDRMRFSINFNKRSLYDRSYR